MKKIQFSKLRIRTKTNDGEYGADIGFKPGLNIIHAENTLGKSTCLQAIIYALGLEGTLGPSRSVPLKNALTKKLKGPDKREHLVIETMVYLEIKNSFGSCVTLGRSSTESKKDLICVWFGEGLTSGFDSLDREDYFVRLEGAAVRERGFHRFLADFMGIELPSVLRFDGGHSPLYLEALFTIYYVEQTRGWGGIQNVLPTYLGIRDMAQKVIEFTLNLDAQEIHKRRQSITSEIADIERIWVSKIDRLQSRVGTVSGYLPNMPDHPKKDLFYQGICDVYIHKNLEPIKIESVLDEKKSSLLELQSTHERRIKDISPELEKDLYEKQRLLIDIEESARAAYEDFEASERYVMSIRQRLSGIKETLKKYSDIKRLEKIGSEEDFNFTRNICPTCKQPISDSLMPHLHDQETLGVDDNIKYLENQKATIESLLLGEEGRRQQKQALLSVTRSKISEYRESIRTIKESLTSSNNSISKEAIRQEVRLENEIQQYLKILALSGDSATEFEELGKRWELLQGALSAISRDGLSATDHKKINDLEVAFKELLLAFDYKSTDIDDFKISRRNYKPAIDDVELGSEASASDNIRMIWAYLYSLMKVSRSEAYSTNHLGIMILDEPRQQEAKGASFRAFINEASESIEFDQQIIIGTSEAFDDLKDMILGLPINLNHFDQRIIAPLARET